MDVYIHEAFSPKRLREELADPANLFLLASADAASQPAGYAKLRRGAADAKVTGPDPIELQRLYVERRAIGGGLGAALMQASLESARRMGRRTLWLGVWEHNPRAISFYDHWGFTTVGEHVFRLGTEDQRDLIMQRAVV